MNNELALVSRTARTRRTFRKSEPQTSLLSQKRERDLDEKPRNCCLGLRHSESSRKVPLLAYQGGHYNGSDRSTVDQRLISVAAGDQQKNRIRTDENGRSVGSCHDHGLIGPGQAFESRRLKSNLDQPMLDGSPEEVAEHGCLSSMPLKN